MAIRRHHRACIAAFAVAALGALGSGCAAPARAPHQEPVRNAARAIDGSRSAPEAAPGLRAAEAWQRAAGSARSSWERSMARAMIRSQGNAPHEHRDAEAFTRQAAASIRAGRIDDAARALGRAGPRGGPLLMLELQTHELRGATGVALFMAQQGQPGAADLLARLWHARGHSDVTPTLVGRPWSPTLAAATGAGLASSTGGPHEASTAGQPWAERRLLRRATRFFAEHAHAAPH